MTSSPITRPVTLVSFIVPVRNDARRLQRCLDAIVRNQRDDIGVEIIVGDNGSTDDSREVAAAMGARVLSLPGLRVSELRNRAAARATGDLLAFVDADHVIVDTWASAAIAVLADERVGAAGALYSAPAQGSWVQRMYGALRGRTVGAGDVGWLGSGNLVVRKAAFDAVRGFDTSLEACEDVDFCRRVTGAGWRIVGDERLTSVHLGDPATLSALFRAERWRGRDNVRVSLRGKLRLRELPSVVIPIVELMAGATMVGALLTSPLAGYRALPAAATAGLCLVGLAMLRAWRILLNVQSPNPLTIAQAFAVALTYDVARASALASRAPHHRH